MLSCWFGVKRKSLGKVKKYLFCRKINDLETELLQFILPEELLEYFELTEAQKTKDSYTFYLSEKIFTPKNTKVTYYWTSRKENEWVS